MNNPENKQNGWLGAANKIIAIFLIVAAIHVLIIMIFVWFNVWRFRAGDEQSKKKEIIKEKVLPINENVKNPNMGTTTTYNVAAGDSLSKIARKTGTHIDELRSLNHLEHDNLKIGQTLLIPVKPKDSGTSLTDSEILSILKQNQHNPDSRASP